MPRFVKEKVLKYIVYKYKMSLIIYKMLKKEKIKTNFAKSLEKTFKIYYNIEVFWFKNSIF